MAQHQIVDGFYLDLYTASFKEPILMDGYSDKVTSLTLHCIERNVIDGEKAVDLHLMDLGINDADIRHVTSLPQETLNELPNPELVIGYDEWVTKADTATFDLSVSVDEYMASFFEVSLTMSKELNLSMDLDAQTTLGDFERVPWLEFDDSSYLLASGIQEYLNHCGLDCQIVALMDKDHKPFLYIAKCEERYFDALGSFSTEEALAERPYGQLVTSMACLEDDEKLAEQAKDLIIPTLDEFDNEEWFDFGIDGIYKHVPTGQEVHYSEAFDQYTLHIGQYYFQQLKINQ